MKRRGVFGAVCTIALAVVSAQAQQQSVRVRGTVEQVDGPVLSIKARDGASLKVRITDDVMVVAVIKASLEDIKPGSFVGSTAVPTTDGNWKSVEVHIFPEAMRGVGEGDRPYDYKPNSTMTNGTVGNMTYGTVGNEIPNANGATLTLAYKEGSKKIEVVPETVIVMYAPGSKAELKPGAKIYISAAVKQADGTLIVSRINVGRDIAPPM